MFVCCVWLLLPCAVRAEQLQQTGWPKKPKIFTVLSFTEEICQHLI